MPGLAVPAGVNPNRRAVHGPEHGRSLGVAGGLHLDGAEAAGEGVFNGLLDEGAEAVGSVGLFEGAAESAELAFGEGEIAGTDAAADADLPVHGGDAVFDDIDGAADDGGLGEAAQVNGRGFGQQLAGELEGGEDGGEGQCLSFGRGVGRGGGDGVVAAAADGLAPDFAQLFCYLLGYLPC